MSRQDLLGLLKDHVDVDMVKSAQLCFDLCKVRIGPDHVARARMQVLDSCSVEISFRNGVAVPQKWGDVTAKCDCRDSRKVCRHIVAVWHNIVKEGLIGQMAKTASGKKRKATSVIDLDSPSESSCMVVSAKDVAEMSTFDPVRRRGCDILAQLPQEDKKQPDLAEDIAKALELQADLIRESASSSKKGKKGASSRDFFEAAQDVARQAEVLRQRESGAPASSQQRRISRAPMKPGQRSGPAISLPNADPSDPERPPAVVEEGKCCICLDEEVKGVCFVPCGHICACWECANEIKKRGKCPVCRQPVQTVIRTYQTTASEA